MGDTEIKRGDIVRARRALGVEWITGVVTNVIDDGAYIRLGPAPKKPGQEADMIFVRTAHLERVTS